MSGLWALIVLELRTTLRDRSMQVGFVVCVLLGAAVSPGMAFVRDRMDPELPEAVVQQPPPDPKPKKPKEVCAGDTLPPVTVVGEVPAWLTWPAPFVDAADVTLTVETDDDGVVNFDLDVPTGSPGAVRACVVDQIRTERQRRLRDLGLADMAAALSTVRWTHVTLPEPDEDTANAAEPFKHTSRLGALLMGLGMALAGAVAIEAVPRRRGSGLLEQLRSTQTSAVELVAAWVGSIAGMTTVALVLFSVMYGVTSWRDPGLILPAVHAPALAALVAAVSVRTSLTATDVQSSTIRWFGVLFALLGTGGIALALSSDHPALAALVPLGGSMLACTGLLGGWGFLADPAALAWTAVVVVWCARSLDAEEATAGGVDHALQRRARGNWIPEVVVFSALGMSTATMSSGAASLDNLWLGITLAFVAFLLIPSLLAAPVLGLDRRELLPLGRPQARNLALVVPVVVGMFGLSALIMTASVAVMPSNPIIEQFTQDMGQLVESPFGHIAIGLVPAICEEFLYRGVILGLLLKSGHRRWALVGQAVAFSVAHVVSIRLPWTFVFGLLMGWIRLRTGSLWASMFAHFLFNVSAGLITVFWADPDVSFEAQALVWTVPLLLGLAALAWMREGRGTSIAP